MRRKNNYEIGQWRPRPSPGDLATFKQEIPAIVQSVSPDGTVIIHCPSTNGGLLTEIKTHLDDPNFLLLRQPF